MQESRLHRITVYLWFGVHMIPIKSRVWVKIIHILSNDRVTHNSVLFRVSFAQDYGLAMGRAAPEGSVYTVFRFIQGSVYANFMFIIGSIYINIRFIQGPQYEKLS